MKISVKSEREFCGMEYVFTLADTDQRMLGCIKKYANDASDYPFHWEVKCDCSVPGNAPISNMIPSSRSGRTLDEAYQSMTAYLESMSLSSEKEVQS